MELELKYLNFNIDKLNSQISTIEDVQSNYTTPSEINFYMAQLEDMKLEKSVLENILNAIKTIK